jgi:hypothetical protein
MGVPPFFTCSWVRARLVQSVSASGGVRLNWRELRFGEDEHVTPKPYSRKIENVGKKNPGLVISQSGKPPRLGHCEGFAVALVCHVGEGLWTSLLCP